MVGIGRLNREELCSTQNRRPHFPSYRIFVNGFLPRMLALVMVLHGETGFQIRRCHGGGWILAVGLVENVPANDATVAGTKAHDEDPNQQAGRDDILVGRGPVVVFLVL